MGEMVEKSRNFVQNVTDVFGKADGGRFKCPRCKGSGFNFANQMWDRNRSSDSCWFCEGVGVMPLIGLNGFMIGRCKPVISTKNLKPMPKLPLKTFLYLGKFPETKCKVKTYKPSMNLGDILYNSDHCPRWASGEVSTLINSPSLVTEASKRGDIRTGVRNTNYETLLSSRKPNSSANKILPRKARVVSPRRTGSGGLSTTVRKGAGSAPVSMSSSTMMSRSEGQADSNSGLARNIPLLRTSKNTKVRRRERNRVREEAEKEALLRAYKFQTFPSEARSSTVADSPDSRQTGDEKMERAINLSLGGTGLMNKRPVAMSSRKLSSDATTINQYALGKVKDGLIRTPSLGKAF